ncbi:hypothetical protein F383_37249 [Gossypium arboreum]|uniref:Uncharacterized protein n=1 Tax=Gossypium arboreum TaxID=29729 RepID=A0A0B0M7S6_GOSAR|nr:hypothetical protein F383_37249 [Gossypium arboreum]
MPRSPQKWPFPDRTLLGLDRDTHGRVVYPFKSCFDSSKWTWLCGLPM